MQRKQAGSRRPRFRRSLLFVPGGEERKVEKARSAAADTVVLDLEDAVPPEGKDAARRAVAAAIRAGGFRSEVAVRLNAPGTAEHARDLEALVPAGAAAFMLPKAERAGDVARAAASLEELERAAGRAEPAALLLLVESPAGVLAAVELARASARVEALCLGHADLSLLMGLEAPDPARGVVLHARCALALAARAASVAPIDTVHLDVRDDDSFRAAAELGRELGFEGKLCIHPRQAEIANEIYAPSPEQIEHARRVVAAWEEARAAGRAVSAFEGKMIDAPLVEVQRRLLERARRAGLLDEPGG